MGRKKKLEAIYWIALEILGKGQLGIEGFWWSCFSFLVWVKLLSTILFFLDTDRRWGTTMNSLSLTLTKRPCYVVM